MDPNPRPFRALFGGCLPKIEPQFTANSYPGFICGFTYSALTGAGPKLAVVFLLGFLQMPSKRMCSPVQDRSGQPADVKALSSRHRPSGTLPVLVVTGGPCATVKQLNKDQHLSSSAAQPNPPCGSEHRVGLGLASAGTAEAECSGYPPTPVCGNQATAAFARWIRRFLEAHPFVDSVHSDAFPTGGHRYESCGQKKSSPAFA